MARASDVSFKKFFESLTGPKNSELVTALATFVLPTTTWKTVDVATLLQDPEFVTAETPAVRSVGDNRDGVTTPLIAGDSNHPSELGKQIHSSMARRFYVEAATQQKKALDANEFVTWVTHGPTGNALDPDYALFITDWNQPENWPVNNASQIGKHITSSYKTGKMLATELAARAVTDHILKRHKERGEIPCDVEADLPTSQIVQLATKIDYIFAKPTDATTGVVGELKTKWGYSNDLSGTTGVEVRDVTQAFVNAVAYSTPVDPLGTLPARNFVPEVITIVIPKPGGLGKGIVTKFFIGTSTADESAWNEVLQTLKAENKKLTDATKLPLSFFVDRFVTKLPLARIATAIDVQLNSSYGGEYYQSLYTKRAVDIYIEALQKVLPEIATAFAAFCTKERGGSIDYQNANHRSNKYAALAGVIVKCITKRDSDGGLVDTLTFNRSPKMMQRVDAIEGLSSKHDYYCAPPGKAQGVVRCLYKFNAASNTFTNVGRSDNTWYDKPIEGSIQDKEFSTYGELHMHAAKLYFDVNAVD